jgi:hypothetical protein
MAQRKTPQQRAQEEFDTAVRVLERAKARKEKVDTENGALVEKYERLAEEKREEIVKADGDVKAAEKRVSFLGTHPDLDTDTIEPDATDAAAPATGDDNSDVL